VILALLAIAAAAPDCVSSQSAMTECAASAFSRADAAMNAQWARTLSVMKRRDRAAAGRSWRPAGPTYVQALLDAQRKWIAFRDAECLSEGYAMRGGSGEPMVALHCKADLTESRTKQLELAAREN